MNGVDDESLAAIDAEAAVDLMEMQFQRAFRYAELRGELLVRETARRSDTGNFTLPGRQMFELVSRILPSNDVRNG